MAIRNLIRFATAVLTVLSLWVGANWTYYANTSAPLTADIIVILGGGKSGTTLSRHSAARLDHGAALYRQGGAPRILVSGGSDNSPSEAEVMRDRLFSLGIPPGVILIETRSRSTLQNALFSERLVGEDQVLLVTQPLHMARARASFTWAGMETYAAPAPVTIAPAAQLRAFAREVAATGFNLVRAAVYSGAQILGLAAPVTWLSGLDAPRATGHPRV